MVPVLTNVELLQTHNHSKCIRPYLLPYTVTAQSATFVLKGNFVSACVCVCMHAWVCVCVCTCTCVYVYVHACVCVCVPVWSGNQSANWKVLGMIPSVSTLVSAAFVSLSKKLYSHCSSIRVCTLIHYLYTLSYIIWEHMCLFCVPLHYSIFP